MSFPKELLDDDEALYLDSLPHWSRLSRPVLFVLVVLGGCIATFVSWRRAPSIVDLVMAALTAVALLDLMAKVLSWRSTNFVVTSHRVIIRSGVLHRVGQEITLDSVVEVTYHQSILDRLLGRGSIRIGVPSDRSEVVVDELPNPARIQRAINRAASVARHSGAPSLSGEVSSDVATDLARLDRLLARGVITNAEYEQKRDELLRRI